MTLNVAIQMDPFETINFQTDSTFALAVAAQARQHSLFYYMPGSLTVTMGKVVARGRTLTAGERIGGHFEDGQQEVRNLDECDVILLRQDPPFDMSYITTTYLLDRVSDKVVVVNDPFWVRNQPEKLLPLQFPDLTPPTLISRDTDAISKFRERYREIVLKPLYGNGGSGVFVLRQDDLNFNALCEMFLDSNREPIIVQKYLPKVRDGDKRIILVDGKPVGALNRIPAADEARSNLHVGGRAEATQLTPREREICQRIGPFLASHGQIFVGIDVIDGWLTEINVTSPTGLVEIARFDGLSVTDLVWDAIETKVRGESVDHTV